jgi:holo-[acyl-carrier protein] synthase
MPPRAFPYLLKLGTDICHIPRVKSILTRNVKKGEKGTTQLSSFLSRVLTWPERQYFWDRFRDQETAYKDIDKVSQYLAGR